MKTLNTFFFVISSVLMFICFSLNAQTNAISTKYSKVSGKSSLIDYAKGNSARIRPINPIELIGFSPKGNNLMIRSGGIVNFSVDVQSNGFRFLQFTWLVNGRYSGSENIFNLDTSHYGAETTNLYVKMIATDGSETIVHKWTVKLYRLGSKFMAR